MNNTPTELDTRLVLPANRHINLKLTTVERSMIERLAERTGWSMSTVIRTAIRQLAERMLEDAR